MCACPGNASLSSFFRVVAAVESTELSAAEWHKILHGDDDITISYSSGSDLEVGQCITHDRHRRKSITGLEEFPG